MKLSFDPVNGYRVNLPGDQSGEYVKKEDCLAFAEWAASTHARFSDAWCHRYKSPLNPDNLLTTEQLFEYYENLD